MAQERYRASSTKQSVRPGQAQGARPAQKPLSPEEKKRRMQRREELRRQKEAAARRAAQRKVHRKRLFRLCFVVSLVFFALYWVYVAISISYRDTGSEDALPLLIFTEGERKEDSRKEPEEICIGSTKYLPITFLEEYMAISQFGDNATRSFLICSNGQYATFYLGTEEAIINGQHVSLRAPSLLKDDVLHLPVEFFGEAMNCFEFEANVNTYGADVLSFKEEEKPSFYFRSCPTDNPIPFDPKYITVPTEPPTEQPNAN